MLDERGRRKAHRPLLSAAAVLVAWARRRSLERRRLLRGGWRGVSRLVMKFGGTSVADLERIRRVARLVRRARSAGQQVAVVVSAMAGKTNELVAWTDGAGAAAAGLAPSTTSTTRWWRRASR